MPTEPTPARSLPEPLYWASATTLAKAIADRRISSREVTQAFLQRIAQVNDKLNAVVHLDPERAMAEAARADEATARGHRSGPLHGVPITIKDSFDTAGMPSTAGTKGRANFRPAHDATVVARLRAAGAIVMGKSNTPEFTLSSETDNLVYGKTSNPYKLDLSPGGSSGGAAAIVAAGGSPLDIGSDTGGSIRWPAHCCGVAGLRPTSGRVPRTGHIIDFGEAIDSFTQIGPLARYVEDLALALPIIAGPDWRDPAVVPMPLGSMDAVTLPGLRVAFYTDLGVVSPTPEVAKAVRDAADVLGGAGARTELARPELIPEVPDIYWAVVRSSGGRRLRRLLRESGSKEHTFPWVRLDQPPAAKSLDPYLDSLERWQKLQRVMTEFMADHDAVLSPPSAVPAQPHGATRQRGKPSVFSSTMLANLLGWPAAVVRAGTTATGLPVGVQIMAPPAREDVVLAIAHRIEKALGGFKPPEL